MYAFYSPITGIARPDYIFIYLVNIPMISPSYLYRPILINAFNKVHLPFQTFNNVHTHYI